MKNLLLFGTTALVLLGFVMSNTVSAQVKSNLAKENVTQSNPRGPNFVDEDGDGICDHYQEGKGQRQGPGKGLQKGDRTGDQQRKQLRDGSCLGGTAAGDPTPSSPTPQRRGQKR